MDAGRIDEYRLKTVSVHHADDFIPRSLRTPAHDGDFLPHERIDESGFARIGQA